MFELNDIVKLTHIDTNSAYYNVKFKIISINCPIKIENNQSINYYTIETYKNPSSIIQLVIDEHYLKHDLNYIRNKKFKKIFNGFK